jgi:hypothetical protein
LSASFRHGRSPNLPPAAEERCDADADPEHGPLRIADDVGFRDELRRLVEIRALAGTVNKGITFAQADDRPGIKGIAGLPLDR